MTAQPKTYWTVEAYLEMERTSETRHEYHNGEIFAMAGTSRNHSLITGNVFASLHPQLRKKSCEVHHESMRLKVSEAGLYTYPDVMVVCGTPKLEKISGVETVTNPTLLIEVLSQSTEAYDRGKKFEDYRTLSTLEEYVLIEQDKAHMERFLRQPTGEWLFAEVFGDDAVLQLTSIDCVLAAADVYERVVFPPAVFARNGDTP